MIQAGLWGMFVAAFIAGTLIPFSSEVVFSALYLNGYDAWLLTAFATVGNVLGGMTNYYLGRLGNINVIEHKFKLKPEKVQHSKAIVQRWGPPAAALSFLPFLGNIIALCTGVFQCAPWKVLTYMILGKTARYIVWFFCNTLAFN